MPNVFANFDFENFWDNTEIAFRHCVSSPLTDEMVTYAEQKLSYKLPQSYIELMRYQNGGKLEKNYFQSQNPTIWTDNRIAINAIYGISTKDMYGLCGERGSQYIIENENHPQIGVYFANCPLGYYMFALDYRECGKDGEPSVVYVAQQEGFEITFLARDFETFIKGLKNESEFKE